MRTVENGHAYGLVHVCTGPPTQLHTGGWESTEMRLLRSISRAHLVRTQVAAEPARAGPSCSSGPFMHRGSRENRRLSQGNRKSTQIIHVTITSVTVLL